MCDAFLDTTLKSQYIKEIIDKLGFIKIEKFCSVKDNEKRMRRQVTDREKIFAKDTSVMPDSGTHQTGAFREDH